MGERFSGEFKRQGDVAASSSAVDAGKKLLGEIQNDIRLGGPPSQVRRMALPSGETVEARFVAGQPQVRISGGEGQPLVPEQTLLAYIGSTGGLRIFDVDGKRLLRTITGLEPYDVAHVTTDGSRVLMTGALAQHASIVVHVDLAQMTAYSRGYTVDTVTLENEHAPGRAIIQAARTSGDRVLWAFGVSTDNSGAAIDGIGGYVLVDATTLNPLRPAIRMSARPHAVAWRPDGQRFYIGAALPADAGDFANPDAFTSMSDYVAVFTRDGAHLGSTLVATWTFEPNSGFYRKVHLLEATNDVLFAVVRGGLGAGGASDTLRAYNANDDGLPLLASVPLTEAPGSMQSIGGVLVLHYDAGRREFYRADGSLEFLGSATRTEWDAGTHWSFVYSSPYDEKINKRPPQGQVPDPRVFFPYRSAGATRLRAYTDISGEFVYDFDLSAYGARNRYALLRPAPTVTG